MKLRIKIFLIFTAIAIIPLIFLTTFTWSQYVRITNNRMSDIVSSQFANISKLAGASYNTVQQAFKLLTFYSDDNYSLMGILKKMASSNEGLSDYDIYKLSKDMNTISQNVCYTYRDIYGIYVFSPSGSLISHTTGQNGDISYDYDPTLEEWYQDTLDLKGSIYTSPLDIHTMFQTNKQSIFFAQSVRDIKTHQNLGVIVLDCSPSLFNLETSNSLGTSNLITLWNKENHAILFSNRKKTSTDFSSPQNQVLKTAIPDSTLELALIFDYKSLASEFNTTGFLLLFVSLFCILSLIFFAYRISGNFILPIQQLSSQMLHQHTSRLSLCPDYSGRRDEIGTLYRQYNSMIEELNTSIKKDYLDKLILLDAQMKSLEARINSHFLFNTLESINSMAEIEENTQIATMSVSLGNMFRYAIKTESELVTLQEELNHVFDYTSIQQIRFQNKFRLIVQIPDNLHSLKTLKLILQPLVENALCHGLCYCTCGNEIRISAQSQEGNLLLSVSDNGKGISPKRLLEVQKHLEKEASFTELGRRNKQSIGLKNIQSRIELYYGKGYGLSVESILEKGTVIHIKIPVLTAKEETSHVHLSHN